MGSSPLLWGKKNQYWVCKKMAVSSRKSGIGAIKGQKKTNFSQTGKKEARFHGDRTMQLSQLQNL